MSDDIEVIQNTDVKPESQSKETWEVLRKKAKEAPQSPGIYMMYGSSGAVIYVGKAKNIQNRIRNYFQSLSDQSAKTQVLMSRVRDLEFLVTDNEAEALVLECELIKKHRPRYNVRLKDDKNFPYLKIDEKAEFPKIIPTRRVKNDGFRYFGPFVRGGLNQIKREVEKLFLLRDCTDRDFSSRTRPCISYDIGVCTAPCVSADQGGVSQKEYLEQVEKARLFLSGKTKKLLKKLEKDMKRASENLAFEKAAQLRDQMEAVQSFDSQQKIIDANKTTDSDIYGFAEKSGDMEVSVLFVRGGRVSSYRKWSFVKPQHSPSELLTEVITQYYIQNLIPEEILLPFEIQDQSSIEDYLKGREKKVRLSVPKKGRKKKMVDMACKNASLSLKQSMEKRGQAENLLKGLQEKLHLRHFPGRIECFDISHFQGSSTVASQVVFVNGEPEKESYRKYHIKEVSGPDDFKSMYEVLSRRFTSKNQKELPNLLVVDGGQGQLSQALLVLQELSLEGAFDVVGLAKSRVQDSAQERNLERSDERVFLPNRKNPVHLKSGDPSCHLMERVRDEAHRFAITFHRSQQKKRLLKSGLDDIEGIGPKKKKALLKVFGSVRGISEASLEELQEVKGVDEVMARKLKESLKLTP